MDVVRAGVRLGATAVIVAAACLLILGGTPANERIATQVTARDGGPLAFSGEPEVLEAAPSSSASRK
jgi:hypothetical protein